MQSKFHRCTTRSRSVFVRVPLRRVCWATSISSVVLTEHVCGRRLGAHEPWPPEVGDDSRKLKRIFKLPVLCCSATQISDIAFTCALSLACNRADMHITSHQCKSASARLAISHCMLPPGSGCAASPCHPPSRSCSSSSSSSSAPPMAGAARTASRTRFAVPRK
eukprot:2397313-Rhodomonas_salina.2